MSHYTTEGLFGQDPIPQHLDDGHISPQASLPGYVTGELLPGGLLLKRTGLGGSQQGGGPRGDICGFSAASKRRLTEKLMGVPWDDLAGSDKHVARAKSLFVTLTYPIEFPDTWKASKSHLQAWQRRVERHIGRSLMWALWKAEEQKRGAPHYHLVIVFQDDVSVRGFQDWARRTWFEVVDSGDAKHLAHGVHVQPLYQSANERRRLMMYLVKYMAKVWIAVERGELPRATGRAWGVWGKMPCVVHCEIVLKTRGAWTEFQRRIRRWAKQSPYLSHLANAHGLRLFGGRELLTLLRGLDVYSLWPDEVESVVFHLVRYLDSKEDVAEQVERGRLSL